MRIFKTRRFARWAKKAALSDETLRVVVEEIISGLVDADLGGGVLKKRVAAKGRGKRGSLRTLIAYRDGEVIYFMYGFEKNDRDNIDHQDLRALRFLAKQLLAYRDREWTQAVAAGELREVEYE